MIRARTVLGAMVVLAVVTAGCGDDNDTAAGNEAYCDLARELDAQDEFADKEQLEAIRDAAPDEISDEAETAVEILLPAIKTDDPEAAFDDPELREAIEVIEAYEAEHCGIEQEDGDDAAGEIDPEFADYCATAVELDEQEAFPSAEQLEKLRANAPEEIADEVGVVVDAFLAAGDDPFAAFEAPGVDEAFEVIDPFEGEHCGIEQDDEEDGEDQDPSVTQLDPAATRIDVTATDYAFELSAAPTAGRTSFVMTNKGAQRHVMLLFRKSPGATTEEVLESEGDEGTEQEWESDTAAADEEAVLTADLVPGDYGLICYISSAGGKPHFMLGMTEEFTVS